ncbi:MAG: helicase-related protein [Armatimonadota bacterium]|nr:helicase-related protein [Armatimonadota bacterium]
MRLFVGAELSEDDVRAIERGADAFTEALADRLLKALEDLAADPADPKRRRLEVLAWMVAQGTLEMRVVLPTGGDGRPLPAAQARDYFHAKEGIFTDACGHQLAFSGSVNETAQGWERNYEQFMVYISWDASRPYLVQVAERIRRLAEGREEGWVALPVPEAVRRRLLDLAPDRAPERDPLETPVPPARRPLPPDQRERILFQFLRDAPLLSGGQWIGVRAAGLRPWPHQARIASEIVRRFPERFLLADEVGLGKTVEAGLVLRSLLLAGKVRRCLILVPKGVLRQWQEELYEKFSLNVPAYDGQGFRDYFGAVPTPTGNPWGAYPVLIASSQLAKRRERRSELLAAGPFDLVIVDEAHHARRREFQTTRYRPNRLLQLLEGDDESPGLAHRTRGLLLLTATPMQVHSVELYDLLRQLDLPPAWAVSEGRFLRFLAELRIAAQADGTDWSLLLRLAREGLSRPPQELLPGLRDRLGIIEWEILEGLLRGERPPGEVARLSREGRAALLEACRRLSPLGTKMFRATRELLREYRRRGLLTENVPTRDPQPVWIPMSPAEWELYAEVERYVSLFYRRLEGERKGLGFIMTVYRRRLTSSFAALRRSLERRRAFLFDKTGPILGLADEDVEDADLAEDALEELEEELRARKRLGEPLERLLRDELRAIEALLGKIAVLPEDTKFRQLVGDLRDVLGKRETAVVFTHYTDTMDDLRERLVGLYGPRLACYSGRGGERHRDGKWVPATKEEVKNAFRKGEIQVLLCTEAASEGLNLQTCGVLINYDVPWNPMRVEQRIGRLDRIGQRYPDVWIRHYFLEGPGGERTVEARVYEALEDRIGWFRATVGELQPILGAVERTIERAAMATGEERERVLEEELAELRRQIEVTQAQGAILGEWTAVPEQEAGAAPLTLTELEQVLLDSSLGERFQPHPEVAGAYRLDLDGRLWEVTFDPEVADAHPGRVRLLTYGEELLGRLLDLVDPPVAGSEGRGLVRVSGPGLVRWFAVAGEALEQVARLGDLRRVLGEGTAGAVGQDHLAQAADLVAHELRQLAEADAEAHARRQASARAALAERGRIVLAEAAACQAVVEDIDDGEKAFERLRGAGYPWAGLAKLAGDPEIAEVDDYRKALMREPTRAPTRLAELRDSAKKLLQELAHAPGGSVAPGPAPEPRSELFCLPS